MSEETKWIIRSRNSKKDNIKGTNKSLGMNMNTKTRMTSGASGGGAVLVPCVAPVVLLLFQIR